MGLLQVLHLLDAQRRVIVGSQAESITKVDESRLLHPFWSPRCPKISSNQKMEFNLLKASQAGWSVILDFSTHLLYARSGEENQAGRLANLCIKLERSPKAIELYEDEPRTQPAGKP